MRVRCNLWTWGGISGCISGYLKDSRGYLVAPPDVQLRNAKLAARPYKLTDGGGLFVLVTPAANREGGKYWRLKYRFAGKEKLLAIGVYPTIGAAEARAPRDKAKQALREGRHPQAIKQAPQRAAPPTANT